MLDFLNAEPNMMCRKIYSRLDFYGREAYKFMRAGREYEMGVRHWSDRVQLYLVYLYILGCRPQVGWGTFGLVWITATQRTNAEQKRTLHVEPTNKENQWKTRENTACHWTNEQGEPMENQREHCMLNQRILRTSGVARLFFRPVQIFYAYNECCICDRRTGGFLVC